MICSNLENRGGTLFVGGADTNALVAKYGTPLYVMDEARIRHNCRVYLNALREHLGETARPLYASKAASFKRVYEIMREEGMGIDVVSCGEIYTAYRAGYPLVNAYFHSNNKTDEDIRFAMEHGIGYFVADNAEELIAINRIAGEMGKEQKVLLRLTPGIDPHTYAAVATGNVDSKFGSAIETGQAEEITLLALSLPNIRLSGFHCHVGSQVFDADVFLRSVDIMMDFIAEMAYKHDYLAEELDLGGGFGVRYIESDPTIDIGANIAEIAQRLKKKAAEFDILLPAIRMEPGRSIVADAGLTLYRVGTIKKIPGYKNYVSVDGGMTDNPRYALYRSAYTVLPANKLNERFDFTCSVVGRNCESGDILQENVTLPASVTRDDVLAVLTTGAYNYAMASNYNRVPRPPIVMVNDGADYLAVRRESLDDLIRNDI
jgi:diaminopimelate decarboxylase